MQARGVPSSWPAIVQPLLDTLKCPEWAVLWRGSPTKPSIRNIVGCTGYFARMQPPMRLAGDTLDIIFL
jgi:hypothetical protein